MGGSHPLRLWKVEIGFTGKGVFGLGFEVGGRLREIKGKGGEDVSCRSNNRTGGPEAWPDKGPSGSLGST